RRAHSEARQDQHAPQLSGTGRQPLVGNFSSRTTEGEQQLEPPSQAVPPSGRGLDASTAHRDTPASPSLAQRLSRGEGLAQSTSRAEEALASTIFSHEIFPAPKSVDGLVDFSVDNDIFSAFGVDTSTSSV
ncbi:unnamed protein product, partial [Laminaria digitata]